MFQNGTERRVIPVVITDRAPNLRTRRHRVEMWGARSTDGEWLFQRLEEPGTPWHALHGPSGYWNLYSSLKRARSCARRDLGYTIIRSIIHLL